MKKEYKRLLDLIRKVHEKGLTDEVKNEVDLMVKVHSLEKGQLVVHEKYGTCIFITYSNGENYAYIVPEMDYTKYMDEKERRGYAGKYLKQVPLHLIKKVY